MRPWTWTAPLACALLTASCASRPPISAPQIQMPAEASNPCELYLLPPVPTRADLEIGYTTRGAQILACEAARRLAVETHAAEHALESRALGRR